MFSEKNTSNPKLINSSSLLQLRLSPNEIKYYTTNFEKYSNNENLVSYINFPKLLGLFGTIAEKFVQRIFEIFSSNKNYITLNEYLKYIDIYHYGNNRERCLITCKLMDFNNNYLLCYKMY